MLALRGCCAPTAKRAHCDQLTVAENLRSPPAAGDSMSDRPAPAHPAAGGADPVPQRVGCTDQAYAGLGRPDGADGPGEQCNVLIDDRQRPLVVVQDRVDSLIQPGVQFGIRSLYPAPYGKSGAPTWSGDFAFR